MVDKSIDKRIASEVKRLTDALSSCSEDRKAALDGLIKRAAFMRVKLEDLEEDIKVNGMTEWFAQTDKVAPYERRRPSADVYLSLNKNYQTIIKQINDLLPKAAVVEDTTDEFEDFVNGR